MTWHKPSASLRKAYFAHAHTADAGEGGERFESPGIGSPTSEPAAFTRPPAEHFSSMGNCPALQSIINRIAGFLVMRCLFLLCFSRFNEKSKS